MVKLTDGYSIFPNRSIPLRHFCKRGREYSIHGSPVGQSSLKDKSKKSCWNCGEPTPKKIQFIYNLWKFHNDKNY